MYVVTNGRRELTRDAVARLRSQGKHQAEIARELGLTKAAVAYHFRTAGDLPDERFARRYDWAEIQRAYDGGLSVRECAAKFGFNRASWYEAVQRGDVVPRPRGLSMDELLCVGRKRGRYNLKNRLIDAGLKENRCEECGLREWRGRPLSMALHHVNGDGTDNRLVNLLLLCPNCHAQTPNYGGRNWQRRSVAQDGPAGPSNGDRAD
jgi:AcrR family transcriptional regulator